MVTAALEHKPMVLVVDDNPLIVNVIRSLLLSQDIQVATAANGEEALEVLSKRPVDVIVCDVMMPRMDGYQLHHKVRSCAEYTHIPFVFLTALDQAPEVQRGLETGADDYITKPFAPEALIAIVKGKLLRADNIRDSTEQRHDMFRKRVIHTLSHEFRTPLVAINTGTEMLLEQLVKPHANLDVDRIQHLLEAIQRGGQRLERLVSDFMFLQQIEAGVSQRLYDSKAAVHLVSSLLDVTVEAMRGELEREQFTLRVENLCEQARVWVYEPQVLDILRRLISNAIKFRSNRREIDLRAYPQEQEIVIEVRDRGIGFDPVKMREAIEAFGQLNREKLEQQGGGLGLAISSRYAVINKCRLEFEAREGGGAVVRLVLPRFNENPPT